MADIEDEPAEKPEKMENYEVKKADFMHEILIRDKNFKKQYKEKCRIYNEANEKWKVAYNKVPGQVKQIEATEENIKELKTKLNELENDLQGMKDREGTRIDKEQSAWKSKGQKEINNIKWKLNQFKSSEEDKADKIISDQKVELSKIAKQLPKNLKKADKKIRVEQAVLNRYQIQDENSIYYKDYGIPDEKKFRRKIKKIKQDQINGLVELQNKESEAIATLKLQMIKKLGKSKKQRFDNLNNKINDLTHKLNKKIRDKENDTNNMTEKHIEQLAIDTKQIEKGLRKHYRKEFNMERQSLIDLKINAYKKLKKLKDNLDDLKIKLRDFLKKEGEEAWSQVVKKTQYDIQVKKSNFIEQKKEYKKQNDSWIKQLDDHKERLDKKVKEDLANEVKVIKGKQANQLQNLTVKAEGKIIDLQQELKTEQNKLEAFLSKEQTKQIEAINKQYEREEQQLKADCAQKITQKEKDIENIHTKWERKEKILQAKQAEHTYKLVQTSNDKIQDQYENNRDQINNIIKNQKQKYKKLAKDIHQKLDSIKQFCNKYDYEAYQNPEDAGNIDISNWNETECEKQNEAALTKMNDFQNKIDNSKKNRQAKIEKYTKTCETNTTKFRNDLSTAEDNLKTYEDNLEKLKVDIKQKDDDQKTKKIGLDDFQTNTEREQIGKNEE